MRPAGGPVGHHRRPGRRPENASGNGPARIEWQKMSAPGMKSGSEEKIPFSKGSENPLAGSNLYGGARGRFPPEIPLGRGNVFMRGPGGVPILPLRPPQTPPNPLQTAGRCPEPAGLPPRPAKHGTIRGIISNLYQVGSFPGEPVAAWAVRPPVRVSEANLEGSKIYFATRNPGPAKVEAGAEI